MTKDELIYAVAAKTDISKKDTERVVNATLDTVIKTLIDGDKIAFTGFGTFSVNKREARIGVNPQHPEQKIKIPAMNVPKFKAGKSLKDAIR
ncbi:MAG: HU family DNA-binding protein [Patescibacteria group bacterium]|nr:HU family DNA-binding protein [Patescibacteria group bacterium]